MKYDAIVIGSGNGGLVAALTLQQKGKKVLLLEKHNLPGGFATSFKRGRFEFEASLHELCQYGTKENPGDVYRLFERLGIIDKIKMQEIDETFHVISLDTEEEYTMPTGIGNFITKMEEYVPNSTVSMSEFFELCKECKNALEYLNTANGQPDIEVMKKDYANFMKVAAYPVDRVLKALKMPKKAQNILSTYWTYLGSPTSELSFVHYAVMIYSYIEQHQVIPMQKSHELSLALYEKFILEGGVARFLSPVIKINVENGKAVSVITNDKKEYKADIIISNISPNVVYGKLIEADCVPKKARQLINSRILGGRGVSVYLGLNKTPEELGLTNYSYFIYHTLNSSKEYRRMTHLKGDNLVGVVMNNAVSNASPEGTTILYLTSLIFSDAFDQVVTKENYFELKEAIADNLIEIFETGTKVKIRDAIEEIEIATPVTFARYSGHPDGSIYGYLAKGLDNLLPRMINQKNENYIENLYFCGGFGPRLSGYSETYLQGEMVALQALKGKED